MSSLSSLRFRVLLLLAACQREPTICDNIQQAGDVEQYGSFALPSG